MNGILKKQNPILNFLLQHRYSAIFLLVGVFSVGVGVILGRDINTAVGETLIKVGSMLALILLMAAGVLNVMERGKRLRVIQLSEDRLNAVIESINDGMFVVAHDGQVEMVNQAAEKRWSQPRDAMLGRPLSDIMPDLKKTSIPEAIKECVRTEKAMTIPNVKLVHDQAVHIYETRLFPFEDGVTVFFNDVTERQQAENERLRISKFESIGLLAGGIAHDFNNIMTGVLGYISFAKLDLPRDNPIYDILSEAEQATVEARGLTQQLLAFSKGGVPVKEMVNISSLLVDETTSVLRGSTVRSEWYLPDDLWPAHVDTTQINQVIQNLVINARQAMPDGGVLTIRGTNLVFGSSTQIKGTTLSPGFYIKLAFSDEGGGMTQEQLNNIFDPYFTTKDTGTGLGLTTVYTIIQRHDGIITVESAPGEGATFEIYLPAASQIQEIDSVPQT
jgi:PAS domain S-box-containing protein